MGGAGAAADVTNAAADGARLTTNHKDGVVPPEPSTRDAKMTGRRDTFAMYTGSLVLWGCDECRVRVPPERAPLNQTLIIVCRACC
jgi:hypothetical protein